MSSLVITADALTASMKYYRNLSLTHSVFDSYTLVSTGKRQPMKLIGWCVFYEKNSLYCSGSRPHLCDWLASKWSAFLLSAVIGARESQ